MMSGSSRSAPRNAAANDVVLPVLVRMVDDCRERRRLAASCRTGDKYQSFVKSRELFHDRRQVELLGRKNGGRNLPEHGSNTVLLIEEIGAIPSYAGNFITESDVAGFFENLDFVFRGDLVEHRLEIIIFQGWELDPLHLTTNAQNGLRTRCKVQV